MKSWEEQITPPSKDPEIEYAYILSTNSTPQICNKETLYNIIKNHDDVLYVTTPENDSFIIPGTDFETLEPILSKRRSKIKQDLYVTKGLSIFVLSILLLIFISNPHWPDSSDFLFLFIFIILPMISGFYELRSIKKIDASNYQREAREIKFNFWVEQQKVIPIYIPIAALALIFLAQMTIGLSDSFEAAGLVKSKVFEGEYWRLITCTLLHGNFMHIIFNTSALYVIGKMVIRVVGIPYFALIFLFSGILGSVFSTYLIDTTSVGASGGIMGLIGFILVLGLKFNDRIPRNIVKSMTLSVIIIAIIGVVGYEVIDNAAHAGGLIGGVIIGLLLKKKKNMIPYPTSSTLKIAGIISIIILTLAIAMSFKQFFS